MNNMVSSLPIQGSDKAYVVRTCFWEYPQGADPHNKSGLPYSIRHFESERDEDKILMTR